MDLSKQKDFAENRMQNVIKALRRGENDYTSPLLLAAQAIEAKASNVPRDLVNHKNLEGDLDGLHGNAAGLSGYGGGVVGHIRPGQTGCVTDYKGDIACMEQSRRCDNPRCRHCQGFSLIIRLPQRRYRINEV
jgi:hypothetical protein